MFSQNKLNPHLGYSYSPFLPLPLLQLHLPLLLLLAACLANCGFTSRLVNQQIGNGKGFVCECTGARIVAPCILPTVLPRNHSETIPHKTVLRTTRAHKQGPRPLAQGPWRWLKRGAADLSSYWSNVSLVVYLFLGPVHGCLAAWESSPVVPWGASRGLLGGGGRIHAPYGPNPEFSRAPPAEKGCAAASSHRRQTPPKKV